MNPIKKHLKSLKNQSNELENKILSNSIEIDNTKRVVKKSDGSGYFVEKYQYFGDNHFVVYNFFKNASLNDLNKTFNPLEMDITNISDFSNSDIYEFGEKPSLEYLLKNEKKNYCISPILIFVNQTDKKMELFKKLESLLEESDKNIQEIKSLMNQIKNTDKDDTPFNGTQYYSTCDTETLEDFFNLIGFNGHEIISTIHAESLSFFHEVKFDSEKINEVCKKLDFNLNNQFEFNDCDNHAFFIDDKEEFKCSAIRTQNYNVFTMISNNETIAIEFKSQITSGYLKQHKEDNIFTLNEILNSGMFSGEFSSSNFNSFNYIPTIEWIKQASVDDIKKLKNKVLHVVNNKILKINELYPYIIDPIRWTKISLFEEINAPIESRIKNNGTFNQLAKNLFLLSNQTKTMADIRHFVFWVLGNGMEVNNEGYLHNPDIVFITEDDDISMIPEGTLKNVYPASIERMDIFKINKDKIKNDWIEHFEKSIQEAENLTSRENILIVSKIREKFEKKFNS